MASKRQERFNSLIHRELAYIFLLDGKKLFHDAIINVSRVVVSPDISYVKVYLSFINSDQKEPMLDRVKQKTNEIRRLLGTRIRNDVRKIPELVFFYDESLDYVEKMDQLFEKIKKEDEQKKKRYKKD